MSHEERTGLSWSVRYGAHSRCAERIYEDTLEHCRAIVARQLPERAGYQAEEIELSGALQGMSFRISRGSFAGSISVQRFANGSQRDGEETSLELRIVAGSSLHPHALMLSTPPTGLRLTSGAAATMGIGALAMAITGGLTAWATAVLLLPALFAARLCMALWIADSLRRRTQTSRPMLPESTRSATRIRDQRRWSAALSSLDMLYENTAERLVLRPFRGLGGATGPQLALPASASASALALPKVG